MNQSHHQKPAYRGRFAPSPTGLLHLGSLTAALGSYLDAKANEGEWLLRIEDIDPPREEPGAKDQIPRQLEQHGLEWDGPIRYQSDHADNYRDILNTLAKSGLTYRCSCSRQRIRELHGVYDRKCLQDPPDLAAECAVRFKIDASYQWPDLIQGQTKLEAEELGGDFIIHRKDGLFSYQLAVAADDHDQGITHVVRGADLLDSTARQGFVIKALGWSPPIYAHLPLITAKNGQKLSKQHHAPILDPDKITENLYRSLCALGQNPPKDYLGEAREKLIQRAVAAWDRDKVPKTIEHPQLC